jgi:hypothetical protein
MSFFVLLWALKIKIKIMSEKNWIPLFCFFFVRKKSVGIMKKYHVLIFYLTNQEKSVFLRCFFRENSFRDIIRKKEGKFIHDESYVSSNECYKWINEWSRREQWLMIVCAMSVRIKELATSWYVLLEVCEDHEKMWREAT